MLYLKQRDPRWTAVKMGMSNLALGRWGCTTTVVAMISDDFGCYKSPPELAHNANNYTPDGLILWNNLNKTFEGQMRFVWRGYGAKGKYTPVTDFSPILKALANPRQRVALEVDNGNHWVKLVRKTLLTRDWTIIDPYYGDECEALARYGNITGYAIFEDLDVSAAPVPTPTVDPELVKRLKGKILLSTEERGQLYYVDTDGKLHSLGSNPEEMQSIIAKLSLGISRADLAKLPWAK